MGIIIEHLAMFTLCLIKKNPCRIHCSCSVQRRYLLCNRCRQAMVQDRGLRNHQEMSIQSCPMWNLCPISRVTSLLPEIVPIKPWSCHNGAYQGISMVSGHIKSHACIHIRNRWSAILTVGAINPAAFWQSVIFGFINGCHLLSINPQPTFILNACS